MKILVLNGPNMNMLGIREPELYGLETYQGLCDRIRKKCLELGVECEFFQSNYEGSLIDRIQETYGQDIRIVINAAGYSHTSVAIGDALKAVGNPAIEVHITDVDTREEYRRISTISSACRMTIKGHGTDGYLEAVEALVLI